MSIEQNTARHSWDDDARITAYALGELDAAEHAEVEALLADDPAARDVVRELRALSGELTGAFEEEYAGGEAPLLSPAARAAIHDRASGQGKGGATWSPRTRRVAASLVVFAGLGLAAAWQYTMASGPESELVASAPAADPAPSLVPGHVFELPVVIFAGPIERLRRIGYSAAGDDEAPAEEAWDSAEALGADDDDQAVYRLRLSLAELERGLEHEDARARDKLLERAEILLLHSEWDNALGDVELVILDEYAEELGLDVSGLIAANPGGEQYDSIHENQFLPAANEPLSTFSVDVDTASYSNVRRMLRDGSLPPTDAVRIEELVNYFPYDYALPKGEHPFAVDIEVGSAPWAPRHRLLRIGLRSSPLGRADRKPSNLVFLLDVSGSMDNPDKLPLVKQSLRMLVEELDQRDHVAIVVYAGAAGTVLEPTSGAMDLVILSAIERLDAGGSTNGGEGIELAYQLARDHFIEEGNNRVILATDGDFNVGVTGDGALEELIAEQAASGVFLTVLGFGTGNLQDGKMEGLADRGNGHYAYIDSIAEARKVLVGEVGASLETVAKDVKLQLEFNANRVLAYRLIGYENRMLAAEDFEDDTKDAGEIGAGHRVTALYELVPANEGLVVPGWGAELSAELAARSRTMGVSPGLAPNGLGVLHLRYKDPLGTQSRPLSVKLEDSLSAFGELSSDTRFAATVAAYGMLLRSSQYAGSARWRDVIGWAASALGDDPGGYRAEFHELVIEAQRLTREREEASGEDGPR